LAGYGEHIRLLPGKRAVRVPRLKRIVETQADGDLVRQVVVSDVPDEGGAAADAEDDGGKTTFDV
jgi:hypothetical protein